jgi:hypothetical protein
MESCEAKGIIMSPDTEYLLVLIEAFLPAPFPSLVGILVFLLKLMLSTVPLGCPNVSMKSIPLDLGMFLPVYSVYACVFPLFCDKSKCIFKDSGNFPFLFLDVV